MSNVRKLLLIARPMSIDMKLFLVMLLLLFLMDGLAANIFSKFFYKFAEPEAAQQIKAKQKRQITVKCDEDQLMLHLANLEVVSPDRIVSLTSRGDLKKFCDKVRWLGDHF